MRALLDSPDIYLARYHRHHTGITSWALSRGRASSDRSSYDLLACLVPTNTTRGVLDLGCGDGHLLERLLDRGVPTRHLIGLDMSPDELALARKRPGVGATTLLCEKASQISLSTASVGHVLCHLSFMVMSEIDTVVSELARVLAPGGLFSAILPGEAKPSGAAAIFHELFYGFYEQQSTRAPVLGDGRVATARGLGELLRPESHFGALEIIDFELCLDGSVAQVWNSLSARYEAYVVLPRDRAALRARFSECVASLVRADGTLPCTAPMRQFTCRRIAAS